MRFIKVCLITVLVVCQWHVLASDGSDQQQYAIRQTAPSAGSTIRRDIVKAGVIPLDKRYTELTVEQKNLLKAEYEHMNDADEPPFPADGLQPIFKAIGVAHESFGLKYKGRLTMYVQVDSKGVAKSVSVSESPDPEITKAAAYALMLQTYKPAVCGGVSCSMQYPLHAELVGPTEHDLESSNPATGAQVSIPH